VTIKSEVFTSLLIVTQPFQETEATGQIIFAHRSREAFEFCVIDVQSRESRCFPALVTDYGQVPVWSPDGNFILYQQPYVQGEPNSYLLDIHDGSTNPISVSLWSSRVAGWSPDGTQFLIVGIPNPNDDVEIYTSQTDGSNLRQLTDNTIPDNVPLWSPDGTQIAYVAYFDEPALMVMASDGIDGQPISNGLELHFDYSFAWSPDSTQIAFVANGDFIGMDQTSEIYVVNADGTDLRQLTDTGGVNLDPRWSPDGSQIVFWGYELGAFDDTSKPGLRSEVFRMNADGSDLVNLTQNFGLDHSAEWSPDGEWIAFSSTRTLEGVEPRPGLFIMRPDGTDVRMLTDEPPFVEGGREPLNPVWRPLAG